MSNLSWLDADLLDVRSDDTHGSMETLNVRRTLETPKADWKRLQEVLDSYKNP